MLEVVCADGVCIVRKPEVSLAQGFRAGETTCLRVLMDTDTTSLPPRGCVRRINGARRPRADGWEKSTRMTEPRSDRRSYSRSASANVRASIVCIANFRSATAAADLLPCRSAFRLTRFFAAGVFGPVDFFHGFVFLMADRNERRPIAVRR
jgi:hypothetical protein